ncbi:MAG: response regulator [Nocardioides sp.]|uniref:hybrid sensor histidine kinase/response regulator n=1 Tax=Nocardioides sp. TaxID=35761 RepID=UPI0023A6A9E5|nr:response regulator [Nocardioides sp.]MDE0777747.1 response regulator [Nocardioides sp.]
MDIAALYRDIVETSPDGIWVTDLRGGILYANEAFADMYGVPVEQITSVTVFDTLDETGKVQFAEHLRRVRAGEPNQADVEVLFHDVTGVGSWVSLRESLLREDGQVVAILNRTSAYGDRRRVLDELRLAEVALRDEVAQSALMRQVADAANAAHTLQEAIPIVRGILGGHDHWVRSTAFRVLDEQGSLEELDPVVEPADEALCLVALGTRATTWSEDGRTVAFCVASDDRVLGLGTITSARDIERRDMVQTMVEAVAVQLARVAEREESERALAAARDAAMAASRQKSEFLATMSHEIRTPLNGIIGLTDLLQRSTLDPEQQRLTSGLQAASHTLLGALNDVLDFSKIDGRPVELEHVDVEVRSLSDQVVRVVSGAASTGGVEVVVWCDRSVPALVLGDPTRLSQVLLNLVSNAVKFSAGGDVLLSVTAPPRRSDEAPVGEDDVVLRFDVADTGIGIEPDQLQRLFEPFTQADATTTRRFGGTGLGLSIARQVVAALGGEIGYQPNPGGGSIFSFEVTCGRHGTQATDLDDYARSWLTGRRVLVADGSPSRGPAQVEQLRWWSVDTHRAEDVSSAHALLADSIRAGRPYEAVLIDARLAGGGGMELAARIAADTAYDQVAMVVVGSRLDVDPGRLREAGVSVFLDRPVAAEALRGTLLEQLAGVPAQPLPLPEQSSHPAGQPRVLVVEDNAVNQLVATGLLTSLGYRVSVAQNGAEALEVLARDTFDAVLMDVQMPVLDGYAATRTLREREGGGVHVPVIAMTASAVDGERERCLAAGMDEFLTKPVDRAALAHVLDAWITTPKEDMPEDRDAVAPELPPTPPMSGLDTSRLDMLRDLDPGDTTYLDRAIANFQANSVNAEAAIIELIAADDVDGLRAAAHKIAGSALNLGIPRAGESARAIEQVASAGTTEGAGALVDELQAAMAEGRALLLAYQATYTS